MSWTLQHGQYTASFATLEQCLEMLGVRLSVPWQHDHPQVDHDGLCMAYRFVKETKQAGRFERTAWKVFKDE